MTHPSATRVADHYATGSARANIERALRDAGKDPERLAPEDLATLEDFHSLGRIATTGLVALAGVKATDRVLDAGSGIGGSSRLLAGQIGCQVIAVDLTPEYCEIARWLNRAVGLAPRIDVLEGDVCALPLTDASVDVVISQHVQMNVADKPRLYAEARRVLRRGGRLALWDVTAGTGAAPDYPMPWAQVETDSHLVSPDELAAITRRAGFAQTAFNDLSEFAGPAMRAFVAAPQPALGLQVYVPDFRAKAENLVAALGDGRLRLIQAVLEAV